MCVKKGTCMECDWHKTFWDDGQSDGCVCDCEEASSEHHINNCMEYITDGNYKGCPYFKDE